MIPLSLRFLGIKISRLNRDELKEYLIQTLYDKGNFRVMVLDERKFFHSLFDAEARDIISNTDVVLCGSSTIAWAARILKNETLTQILPVTLFLDFMRVADEMGYTYYLYGGSQPANLETAKRMRKSFPHARLVGAYHSRIRDKEKEDVMTAIRKSAPQLFCASLGGGHMQEKWLSSHRDSFSDSVVLGVDNAFSVVSGKEKMPPIGVQKKGWTGLYRSLTRPWDIPRFFRLFVIFVVVLYHRFFKKDQKD